MAELYQYRVILHLPFSFHKLSEICEDTIVYYLAWNGIFLVFFGVFCPCGCQNSYGYGEWVEFLEYFTVNIS